MARFLEKFLNILLIIFITFLVLNAFNVIAFSASLRNAFIYLTLILILLTSMKEIFSGKSRFFKFLSWVTLICTVLGGTISVVKGQLNAFVYICLLFSLINGVVALVYSKT